MPQIDVVMEIDDLRETLDTTTTGVKVNYIPCIVHKLLYNNVFCDNRCNCRNACLRLKLGILKWISMVY